MKNLLIIGARGFGREIHNLAVQCDGYNRDFIIKGFLDDKSSALDNFNYPDSIISSVEDYKIVQDDVFICALGDIAYKKKYTEIILEKGGEFINLIHPSVIINNNVNLGIGLILLPYVVISNDVVVADYVTIQSFTAIGHDSKIGKWSQINAHSFTGGFSELEEGVTLHPKATILSKMKIGSYAVVGSGSIVIKNVKPNTTVFGNPAKILSF